MRHLALILIASLTGCGWETRTASASIERTTGVQAGQPVDLTTVRKEQAEANSGPDIAALVQAGVAAATGDIRGTLKTLAERPAPPSADALAAQVAAMLPRDADGGIDGTTGGIIGGASGIALLLAREWMARRQAQRDAEDEYRRANDNHQRAEAYARQLPPAKG